LSAGLTQAGPKQSIRVQANFSETHNNPTDQWVWSMNTNLTFATGRFLQTVRFVVVNNRVPCTDRRCALCGGLIEKGYVRDSQTRLIYCDLQCFPGWTPEVAPVVQNRGRKAS